MVPRFIVFLKIGLFEKYILMHNIRFVYNETNVNDILPLLRSQNVASEAHKNQGQGTGKSDQVR